MKSKECCVLLDLLCCILDDIALVDPTLGVDVDRDKSTLCSLVEARGLWFLTAELPEAGKHFEQCLSTESFTRVKQAGFRPFRRGGKIPRLFKGLYLRVFDESGMLRLDADIMSVRFLRQIFLCCKKYGKECDDKRVYQSVDEFFRIEREVRPPSLRWDEDCLQRPGEDLYGDRGDKLTFGDRSQGRSSLHPDLFDLEEREALSITSADLRDHIQIVCDIVTAELGAFSPSQWRTKHGPGAVSDARVATQAAEKRLRRHFGGSIPTGLAVPKYEFPNWPHKLERVFPLSEFAFANLGLWADSLVVGDGTRGRFSVHEPPSRLLAVPKTQKGPRLIAAEPICYQWCQQAIWDYLSQRVSASSLRDSVSFDTQERNRKLALRASHDRSHWTIDLSSASDRVSSWHVERLFRRNFSLLEALHATRTRWIENSIGGRNPRFHKLRKFSTMGSACTFPVQSLLFACVAIGTILYSRGVVPTTRSIRKVAREVRVFGDDIIVPSDSGSACVESLVLLGFRVNAAKTFGSGSFRESCGMDAYKGQEVTPTYFRTTPRRSSPESIVSCIDTHNNLVRGGWLKTAAYLRSTTQKQCRHDIATVSFGSGQLGFWEDGLGDYKPLKRRLNHQLHRLEYYICSLIATRQVVPDRGASSLLQYFTEAPEPSDRKSVV